MSQMVLLEEDKKLLLAACERSEKEAGIVQRELKSLRDAKDVRFRYINQEKKKPDYEARVDKYAEKANQRVSEYLETGSKASDIIRWVIKAPFILFTIAAVIFVIIAIISNLMKWNKMDEFSKVFTIIGGIIVLPIAGAGIALFNAIGNLISVLISVIIWDIYSAIVNRMPEKYLKKYYSLHPCGFFRERWAYQSKMYAHNPDYPQNEIIRFPMEHFDKHFYDSDKHRKTWDVFKSNLPIE